MQVMQSNGGCHDVNDAMAWVKKREIYIRKDEIRKKEQARRRRRRAKERRRRKGGRRRVRKLPALELTRCDCSLLIRNFLLPLALKEGRKE